MVLASLNGLSLTQAHLTPSNLDNNSGKHLIVEATCTWEDVHVFK